MSKKLDIARPEISSFGSYVPGKPISELKKEKKLTKVYKLASNENAFGVSDKAKTAIQSVLNNINIYPESSSIDLRTTLSKTLKVSVSKILVGNGSDEIIELLGKTFLEPKNSIVVSKHAFIRYKMAADLMGSKTYEAFMTKDYVHDLVAMERLVDKSTKLIFIANPNNPTGTYVKNSIFSEFMKKVSSNVLVVVDEAYYEYVSEDDYPQTMDMISKYKNLIILRTFSKIHALAGLRVGYMIADESVISLVDKIRPPFNVNVLGQVAAEASLRDLEHVLYSKKMNNQEKIFLYQEFDKLGVSYIKSATNFVLFKINKISGRKLFNTLLNYGIIIRSMDEYELPGFARVTVGKHLENVKFIAAIKEIMKKSYGV